MKSALLASAAVVLPIGAAPLSDLTQPLTWTSPAGGTLPYRLLSPAKTEPGKAYPVVLFLHGSGERGSDNASQGKHVVPAFAAVRDRHPCYVIAPQCPAGQKWANVDWSAASHTASESPSEPLRLALEIVDDLVAKKAADSQRVYVAGLSMGGYGAWEALAHRPTFFAAAIPVCGGGDPATAKRFSRTPVWVFHGLEDRVVPPQRSLAMWEALRAAGGNPGLSLYPGVAHDSWTPAFADPRTLDWLFAQKLEPGK